MELFPLAFFTFKFVALGVAMFFAIKWHRDQEKKTDTRAALLAGGKMLAAFVVFLAVVGILTIVLSKILGLDLGIL
jgi:Na+-translocating ferredoxin:NAD+ oxidoreductase RnfD subunit